MGGAILSISAMTGLFDYVRRLFTSRIIAVVLLLVAFTLTPTIIKLITEVHRGVGPQESLTFAILLTLAMFIPPSPSQRDLEIHPDLGHNVRWHCDLFPSFPGRLTCRQRDATSPDFPFFPRSYYSAFL